MSSQSSTAVSADDTGSAEQLERVILGRRVAEVLRGDIIYGRLAPGTRLAQQQLCERFGVSRMPVRDGLRQLVFEGFVVQDAGRHAVVATLSRQDILDTFAVEGMLHGFASRRLAEVHTAEQIEELQERHDEMAAHLDDPRKFANLNWHFHRRINHLVNSRKLLVALNAIAMAMPRDLVVLFPEWVDEANAEHAMIIEAMRRGDGAAVESAMREHVAVGGVRLVEYLEAKGVALV